MAIFTFCFGEFSKSILVWPVPIYFQHFWKDLLDVVKDEIIRFDRLIICHVCRFFSLQVRALFAGTHRCDHYVRTLSCTTASSFYGSGDIKHLRVKVSKQWSCPLPTPPFIVIWMLLYITYPSLLVSLSQILDVGNVFHNAVQYSCILAAFRTNCLTIATTSICDVHNTSLKWVCAKIG